MSSNKAIPLLVSLALTTMLLPSLTACHDGNDDGPETPWAISWADGEEGQIDIHHRYYSLYTKQSGETDTTLLMTTDATWLQLMADTLPSDGILQVKAEANTGANGRTATIRLTSASHRDRTALLTLRQTGTNDQATNDSTDPMTDFRVGWGFNAFDEYHDVVSVRGKILNISRLDDYDSDSTFTAVQEAVRGKEDFKVTATYSLQEMSSHLTKEMVSETNFLGVKKTTRRFTEVTKHSVRDQSCVYARLQKVVASRTIDTGALLYIIEKTTNDTHLTLPYTDEFLEYYNRVTTTTGIKRENAIASMIDKFGTHLITEADVGAKLDLVLTLSKSSDYELETTAEETSKRIFGRPSSSSSSFSSTEHLSSDLSHHSTFDISGGSDEAREKLQTIINNISSTQQLDGKMVQAWINSVSYKHLNNPATRHYLDLVHFHFIPIWKLFTQQDVQANIQSYILAMSHRSDCDFTDRELGLDNYTIDLTNPDLDHFSTADDATLVRVARHLGETPLVEICQEYVPKIRSDRRITVYYPIVEGRTMSGQGFFRGDGEGNPPAILTFSGGEVYVNPLETYGSHDIANTIYYMHGNFYTENYGILTYPARLKTTDETLTINGITYPIVKIGSGYWTRQNIKTTMQFGYTQRGRHIVQEQLIDGMLYANIFGNNSPLFLSNHADIYGSDIDEGFGRPTKWFLPSIYDREDLTTYLGFNHKSLMQGQPSGFNAQFAGYYGHYSPRTNETFANDELRDNGQYCYLPFLVNGAATGEAMVLAPDYTWKTVSLAASHNNRYPVRLFRTSYYRYQ